MKISSRSHGFRKWPVILVCLAAPQLLVSCRKAEAKEGAALRMTVPVVHPQVAEVPYELSYVTELRSAANFPLKAHTGGLVEEVLVEEGAKVVKGQHLFTVASREIQAELAKSRAERAGNEAEAKIARLELENTRLLLEKKIVSKAEVDLAEAKLEAALAKVKEAEAEIEQGELKLEYARVVAPVDGVVSRIPNRAGSRVEEGDALTEFSSDGDIQAYFHVSERDYFALARNKGLFAEGAVALELADGSVYPVRGTIDATDSIVSRETGSISFRVRFANPEGLLKHGGSGRLTLGTKVPDALVIPQRSTFEVQHRLCVFVLGDDDVVRMKTIKPAFRLANHFVIGDGLEAGDRVVFEGIQLVREGDTALADLKDAGEVAPL